MLIELIAENEEVQDVVKAIHYQDTFPFTYDVRKSANMDADYPDPGHDVDDFKNESKVAIEFQVLSRKLQSFQKSRCRKGILFPTIRSISDRRSRSVNDVKARQTSTRRGRVVTPPRTKRTIMSMNPHVSEILPTLPTIR